MLLRQGSSRDARAPSPNLPQGEEQDLNDKEKCTSICSIKLNDNLGQLLVVGVSYISSFGALPLAMD